ncbi:hypothetical protein [Curtobacterium sp. 179-B 9B NHS]|uniref:hypothetical protein n=1 Tax=Curtobacterium sp. 179-B 9B NHS TaxID=3374293 RepID=UPI00387A63B2
MNYHQPIAQHFSNDSDRKPTARALARPEARCVDILCSGSVVPMEPDAARRLAVRLFEAAALAERPQSTEWP